mmetsp:Transcript_3980/g.5580  ORF Transcript_3980/g.5580 Transcript_3980/m.5580 type:complete len:152 (-) Transcript_3980:13-468(-)|eukprot:CAMPEP_0168557120 /NCGR_PEP_ID=MMETSP0413-20121227/9247_1 /TAXON_ID=136452 /ORGANISM="Filamoeba nolandi, Strain NC-AS-23-1" /LENGTH=151 /DNA_ID=CAMNT_0008588113 /DNA_START=36 /DNA_END=491 /DNA_ORIENTATION=+
MSLTFWTEVDPFSEMDRMQRQIDSLFSMVPSDKSSKGERKRSFWNPTCDLRETDKEIILHAELPGVKKEDINIELKDGRLSITGEKKLEKKEENEKFHRVERTYGKFSRTLAVPDGVQADHIKASFTDGVLEVSLPKPEPKVPEPKKITIA